MFSGITLCVLCRSSLPVTPVLSSFNCQALQKRVTELRREKARTAQKAKHLARQFVFLQYIYIYILNHTYISVLHFVRTHMSSACRFFSKLYSEYIYIYNCQEKAPIDLAHIAMSRLLHRRAEEETAKEQQCSSQLQELRP